MINRKSWGLFHLEAFEVLGIAASIVAVVIFFYYGSALDHLVGQSDYHWHMFFVIVGIYAHFVPWLLLAALVVFAGVAFVLRGKTPHVFTRFGFAVRVFLAYCLLLIVFRVVNFYVPVLHPGLRDGAIQHIDKILFGGRLIGQWLQPMVTPWLTGLLTGAYVAWFWLLFATVFLLVFAGREVVSEYVLASLLAFYLGYICYVLVPVIGPGYTVHFATHVGDIAPQFTEHRLLISRDCFPSLHTAISVLMAIYIWRHRRKWAIVYIPVVTLIVLATLYLRFHYGLDDIAGAALAVIVSYLAPLLQAQWRNMQSARWTSAWTVSE